ncbi:MAG TPA: ribose 5-phosphate isomerase B [Saprospiraceae bacterium]|nr:ribose 5-phosphate isomerase B [Saprospiraceae bacterium]
MKTIAIGSDHAGVDHKSFLIKKLKKWGYEVDDKGTYDTLSVDYPDFAHPVAEAVETGSARYGVLICGSANGVCMTANKHQGFRAALCWNAEVAEVVRLHNDANIICIPARFSSKVLAGRMLEKFLNTGFEGGRHQNRIDKIS